MDPNTKGEQEELSVAEALSQLRQQKRYINQRQYSPVLVYPMVPTGPLVDLRSQKIEVGANTVDVETFESMDMSYMNGGVLASEKAGSPVIYADPASLKKEKRGSPLNGTRFSDRPERAWRKMLLTTASLVLSKEAKRKLRNLLNLLRLASEHLNEKVGILKAAMEKDASDDNVTPALSQVAIRNDIIMTIKRSVTMLSTLATNSLPRSARSRLRHMILKLPQRWANQLEGDGSTQSESAVLALATETLLSIRKITNILSETLERADSWVEKLPDKNKNKDGEQQSEETVLAGFGEEKKRDEYDEKTCLLEKSAGSKRPFYTDYNSTKKEDNNTINITISNSPTPGVSSSTVDSKRGGLEGTVEKLIETHKQDDSRKGFEQLDSNSESSKDVPSF